MAKLAESEDFLTKALATLGIGLALTVGGFGVLMAIDNSNRLTRLEAQAELAERIEEGFDRLERAIREAR